VNRKSIASDVTRLDSMKDSNIGYSDIPPLGDEFLHNKSICVRAKVTDGLYERQPSTGLHYAPDEIQHTAPVNLFHPSVVPNGPWQVLRKIVRCKLSSIREMSL